MPGFPALFRISLGARQNEVMPGWRRSSDRTGLQLNSLQTGNFSGNLTILAWGMPCPFPEMPQQPRLSQKFPNKPNREVPSQNSDILSIKQGNQAQGRRHSECPLIPRLCCKSRKLQRSNFFGENLKRKEVDDSHGLSRATEVAHEFGARR
jgi:hypothetical protein